MNIEDFDKITVWCWTCPICGHYNEVEGDPIGLTSVYCAECDHKEPVFK